MQIQNLLKEFKYQFLGLTQPSLPSGLAHLLWSSRPEPPLPPPAPCTPIPALLAHVVALCARQSTMPPYLLVLAAMPRINSDTSPSLRRLPPSLHATRPCCQLRRPSAPPTAPSPLLVTIRNPDVTPCPPFSSLPLPRAQNRRNARAPCTGHCHLPCRSSHHGGAIPNPLASNCVPKRPLLPLRFNWKSTWSSPERRSSSIPADMSSHRRHPLRGAPRADSS